MDRILNHTSRPTQTFVKDIGFRFFLPDLDPLLSGSNYILIVLSRISEPGFSKGPFASCII